MCETTKKQDLFDEAPETCEQPPAHDVEAQAAPAVESGATADPRMTAAMIASPVKDPVGGISNAANVATLANFSHEIRMAGKAKAAVDGTKTVANTTKAFGALTNNPVSRTLGRASLVAGVANTAISGAKAVHNFTKKGGSGLAAAQDGADTVANGVGVAGSLLGPTPVGLAMGAFSAGYSLGGAIDKASGAKKGTLGGLSGALGRSMYESDPAVIARAKVHEANMAVRKQKLDAHWKANARAQLESVARNGPTEAARARARDRLARLAE